MTVTLTLSDELAERLRQLADERGCTLEELIIQILEEWLAQQEIPPEAENAQTS